MLTLQTTTYIEENDQTGGPIWNCVTGSRFLERVLNRIALSNSTAGNCAPIPVTKQSEQGDL